MARDRRGERDLESQRGAPIEHPQKVMGRSHMLFYCVTVAMILILTVLVLGFQEDALEVGDLVSTWKGRGWICGTKNGVYVKLIKDEPSDDDLWESAINVWPYRISVKLLKKRFTTDGDGKPIPNLLTACGPVDHTDPEGVWYVCPWCKLTEEAQSLAADIFGYKKCCQDHFNCTAPHVKGHRENKPDYYTRDAWTDRHGAKTMTEPEWKGYFGKKVMPLLLKTAKWTGEKADGSWPAGLGLWGPCPKCLVDVEKIINETENDFASRKQRLNTHMADLLPGRSYSVDFEIDTPFEPTFFNEMKRIVDADESKKPLATEILKIFRDAVLDKWNVGDYVSLGFNQTD